MLYQLSYFRISNLLWEVCLSLSLLHCKGTTKF